MPTKKKETTLKNPPKTKVSAKKTSAKKVVVVKPVAKPAVKPVAKPIVKAVAKPVAPKRRVVTKKIVQTAVMPARGRTVTHHRVVLHETCKNCAHLPDRVGSLVGTLSILVAILSAMVLSLAEVPNNWQNLVAHSDQAQISIDQTFARN